MSAVYILYVCHDVTTYEDLNRGGTIGETKREIYGVYSKKKRSEKHIKECLKEKAYYEQYLAREGILNLKDMSIKETNRRNPGFEITMIMYDWNSGIPDKLCKMKINYWCYVERYVVD